MVKSKLTVKERIYYGFNQKRKSTFSVIYWYLDNAGERKQKWDTLETKKEAKQRKAFVEYYQEKYGYVIVPLEEQFARQIDESKKNLIVPMKILRFVTFKNICQSLWYVKMVA